MTQINRNFEKGDFVKYTNKPASFGIFEGIDLDPTMKYAKKWSMVLYYDPSKYCQKEDGGWGSREVLELPKDGKPCPKTIETLKEDYSWKICTPTEKKQCLEKLAEYGLEWNEEEMTLVDTETGEVIHKIFVPKIEYNGEVVKPIQAEFKEVIKKYVINENKPTYTTYNSGNSSYRPGHSPYYGRYDDYDEYGWD